MIIDSTYFIREIKLPNLNQSASLSELNSYIEKYEAEILKDLLGYQLYSDFITAIAEDEPDQKWVDLRDGAEFSFDFGGKTITRKWNGLKNSDKVSLIAYYVWFFYHRKFMQRITETGIATSQSENSVGVSSVLLASHNWNMFLELYGEVPYWFDPYYSTYEHYTDKPSAYNFLLANSDDYDNWIFTKRENVNAFGF